jgi:TonB family protein
MFNNLIESSSHTREYKRRGSFLLFTGATYLVLFVVAGVASIYAYDAHLEAQTTQLELLSWVPQPPTEAAPEVLRNTIRTTSNSATTPVRSVRVTLIDSTSNPLNVPDHPGTAAPTVPPARIDSVVGRYNGDPPGPPSGSRGTGGNGNTPVQIEIADPPPAPQPTPKPQIPSVLKVSRVLNSQALSLPRPNYPPLARNIRLQGNVIVQVLIDESGKVVSAKVTSGHPLFAAEAQRAAMQARFSPTVIGETPVKVSGVITYEFKLNN